MVVDYIFYVRRTGVLVVISFSTSIISVALNYFAIQQWDAMGVASYALPQFVTFIIVWIAANRLLSMPWNLIKAKRDGELV